ncbi:HAD-IIA family hydrolase [Myxococcota bacterium]|nr:HAD-IIA family hydrolase [Myxococcota bacterium]
MMELYSRIQAFFLDLDGTCYVGTRELPATLPFLEFLLARGIPYLFLTNNSSTTAHAYVEKLRRRGFPVRNDQVLTCGDAAARYLLQDTPYRRIYLVATPPVEEEFRRLGFTLTSEDAEAVLLTFDTGITYRKIEEMAHLLYAGVPYFATQPDITCITEKGLTPDVGVFIAGMKVMTGREPMILGKPSLPMVQAGLERLGLTSPEHVAMVGDQMDTDMTMGVTQGLISFLVLTGETSREKAAAFPLKPDRIVRDLGEIHAGMISL